MSTLYDLFIHLFCLSNFILLMSYVPLIRVCTYKSESVLLSNYYLFRLAFYSIFIIAYLHIFFLFVVYMCEMNR